MLVLDLFKCPFFALIVLFQFSATIASAESGSAIKIDVQTSGGFTVRTEISEEQAIAAADLFVTGRGWGDHTSVLRTGSSWFRVEYGKTDLGVDRFVLVNPQTGEVEDTKRR